MQLKSGTLLQGGKYRIVRVLGQGSFGITYLASAKLTTHGSLGSMEVEAAVAIKEFYMRDFNSRNIDAIHVDGTDRDICINYRKRFRKEAQNLAKFNHPNIVKVSDVFDENNTTYYVMEYISNKSLIDVVNESNGLDEIDCIKYIIQIGEALQYMHSKNTLHLDLKPGNVMIKDGKAILIDFGLSKQFNASGNPETSSTIGLGTPGYSPLEQTGYDYIEKDGLPYTIDIYALGATLYKMLTGITPPHASLILNEGLPNPRELTSRHISEHLVDCVYKAISPLKGDRYQTVREMINNLSDLSEESNNQRQEDECTVVNHPDNQGNLILEDCNTSGRASTQSDKKIEEYKLDFPKENYVSKEMIIKVVGIGVMILIAILLLMLASTGGCNQTSKNNEEQFLVDSDSILLEEPTPINEEPTPINEKPIVKQNVRSNDATIKRNKPKKSEKKIDENKTINESPSKNSSEDPHYINTGIE